MDNLLRYAECTPRGRLVLQLCPDGYALDLQHGVCDLASKVNCEGRTKQQVSLIFSVITVYVKAWFFQYLSFVKKPNIFLCIDFYLEVS
jgi:hypothetical protein